LDVGFISFGSQVKRPQARTFFATAIADMYAEVAGKEESDIPRSNL